MGTWYPKKYPVGDEHNVILCKKLGMDTISAGMTIAWAIVLVFDCSAVWDFRLKAESIYRSNHGHEI
jgi:hypothetical protein